MAHGEAVREGMLVGTRFSIPKDWVENAALEGLIRGGHARTFVVALEPISGPIYRYAWYSKYFARCGNCGETSREYAARNSTYLRQWAHNHRCKFLIIPGK